MNNSWPALLVQAPWLVMVLAKATVLLAAAWAVHLALQPGRPGWRVVLWRMAAVGVMVLPLACWSMPRVEVLLPSTGPAAQAVAASSPGAVAPVAAAVPGGAWGAGAGVLWLLGGVWFLGVAGRLGVYTYGRLRVRRVLAGACAAPARLEERCRQAAASLGRKGPCPVMVHADVASPFVLGVFSPLVVLPRRYAQTMDEPDLTGIFAHELSHLRGLDPAWALLMDVVATLLWFHPLVWGMGRAHRLACEQVSDLSAARVAGGAIAYRRTLARVALFASGHGGALAGAAMANPSELARRMKLLDGTHRAAAVRTAWVMLLCGAALLVIIGLAAVAFAFGPESIVRTEYGPAPLHVAWKLDKGVSLAPPYATAGASANMISVQQAVTLLTDQAGLDFNWAASYPAAYPGSTVLIRPQFHGVPCGHALRQVLQAGGLSFGISNGAIVLRPGALGAEAARTAPSGEVAR